MNRLGTFVGITVVAAMCAVAAWWSLLILGVGGDPFFGATIVHANLVIPIALACGAVVGLTGATGHARDRVLRRSVAASLRLLALALAAIVALFGLWGPSFSAAEFRSAADARNDDTMEFQAHLAVEQDRGEGRVAALYPARSASSAMTRESCPPCHASGDLPGSSDTSSAPGIAPA